MEKAMFFEFDAVVKILTMAIIVLPFLASVAVGFLGRYTSRAFCHRLPCFAVGVSFILSLVVFYFVQKYGAFHFTFYTWLDLETTKLTLGCLIDPLSAMMMGVVTFVSLAVHIYTIGYMKEDEGYARFFAYIAFFTFAMLTLVTADNFLQMFFGWEGVGLASYLLIGFWFTRESAIKAGMKAFVMNRVGDFGFIIGIGLLFAFLGATDFLTIFDGVSALKDQKVALWKGVELPLVTTIALALFVGAMGKSAQFPLHTWLPDSMEGPTPISALIHAATMVTAGIFMVARCSPIFELSDTALSVVMIVGAITALFMALLGLAQNDIKRVIAYSTLSQLGYMTVALGVSAYSAALFHLMTHAFFKALLFLAAGSVIIALHHSQDLRKMGGLWKRLPITYATALIGALALSGLPPFSGFFSKEPIIEAAKLSNLYGHQFASVALTVGVFLTALYTFRMIFLAFHGSPRWESHGDAPREAGWVVWAPLVALAIPSIFAGGMGIEKMLYGGYFGTAIYTVPTHSSMTTLMEHWHGIGAYFKHALFQLPTGLALLGIACAWFFTLYRPTAGEKVKAAIAPIYRLLENNYYIDALYEKVFAQKFKVVSRIIARFGETGFVRGVMEYLPTVIVMKGSTLLRHAQTGYLYHYAFLMALGLLLLVMLLTRWGN